MKIELDKKKLKQINELNQDLKSTFNSYILTNSGIIYSDKKYYKAKKGIHFGTTTVNKLYSIEDKEVLRLVSPSIYIEYKSHKKYIDGIYYQDNDLYFSTNEDHELKVPKDALNTSIGLKYSLNKSQIDEVDSYSTMINKVNKDPNKLLELSEEDVLLLYGNTLLTLTHDKYKIRMTKELIPGLKKNHMVSCYFEDVTNLVFSYTIICHRNESVTYHKYMCTYMN